MSICYIRAWAWMTADSNNMEKAQHKCCKQEGFSLIELSIVMVIVGLLLSAAMAYSKVEREQRLMQDKKGGLAQVETALRSYYIMNGSYPCPAGTVYKKSDAQFGRALEKCRYDQLEGWGVPEETGVHVSENPAGKSVVTGIFPFRSLGISDRAGMDVYGNLLQYAVSEDLTDPARFSQLAGAIDVVADNGQSRLSPSFSAQFVVFSTGQNGRGGYSSDGVAGFPCESDTPEGENCDNDAVFMDSGPQFAKRGKESRAVFDDYLFYKQYDQDLGGKGGILFYYVEGCPPDFVSVSVEDQSVTGVQTLIRMESGGDRDSERPRRREPELCYSAKYAATMALETTGVASETKCPSDWEAIGYRKSYMQDSLSYVDDDSGVSFLICAR